MDITAIIIIIVIMIIFGLIDELIQKKAPIVSLGIYIFLALITDGLLKLIIIIFSIKKAHELFVKTENNEK